MDVRHDASVGRPRGHQSAIRPGASLLSIGWGEASASLSFFSVFFFARTVVPLLHPELFVARVKTLL